MRNFARRGLAALLFAALLTIALTGAALAATVTAADGQTYIRNTPSLTSKIAGVLPKGATVECLGRTKDARNVAWYKVSYNGVSGWVSSMYVSYNDDASFNAIHGEVVASGGSTHIRSTPSLSGQILTTLPKGKRANYLGQSKEDSRGVVWYYVTYETTTGWVSSRYTTLREGSASSNQSGSASSGQRTYTKVVGTGGKSNIRNAPNLSGKSLGVLPKGATANYLGETKYDNRDVAWYKISYKGTTGWVSSKYTTLK